MIRSVNKFTQFYKMQQNVFLSVQLNLVSLKNLLEEKEVMFHYRI